MNSFYPPPMLVTDAVNRALAEDIGPLGDLTAALVPADQRAEGALVARVDGVLAGRSVAEAVFAGVDPAIVVVWSSDDGVRFGPGTVLATVAGPLASVLTAERTALNFLCHLSGVATATRSYVDAVAHVAGVVIRDTRKTTPGLRALEKAAVRAGGGFNHRASLSDGILVKDNHLTGLSVAQAVAAARAHWPGRAIQVECESVDQVQESLAAGAELVLLDNMPPADVKTCVAVVNKRCLVEVSGGVTLTTVADYAAAGPDFISVGALTHSAPIVDIGLDI